MSTLTDDQLNSLLSECRAYLGITWTDEAADNSIRSFIRSSTSYLEGVYGDSLNFTEPVAYADFLASDLLKNRVFYQREKALDDFPTNYQRDLLLLRNLGKAKRKTEEEAAKNAYKQ